MINRTKLSARINQLIASNPGFVDDLLGHTIAMMPPTVQPALKGSVGWIFRCGRLQALVINLPNEELITEHSAYLHNFGQRVRINSGITQIRLMRADYYLGELRYNPAAGKWHFDRNSHINAQQS
jgi:hypothetical protein